MASLEVPRSTDGVAVLDATWQDYPQWESPEDAVAFKAPSLVNPESPPYPGYAVRTQPEMRRSKGSSVVVELWANERPAALRLLHTGVLHVGRAGVELGNAENSLVGVAVPSGDWTIEIWVDEDSVETLHRVAFVLPHVLL